MEMVMAVAGCGSKFRCDIVHPCEALEGQILIKGK